MYFPGNNDKPRENHVGTGNKIITLCLNSKKAEGNDQSGIKYKATTENIFKGVFFINNI
jgi:hypothetical protein